MATFGKSIMDNLDDEKSLVELDPAYEGVCSDEFDDDCAEDLIDHACYAFEACDCDCDDDDDDYDDIIDTDASKLTNRNDDDFDDCSDDDDYDDIVDGIDAEEMEDIMDDSAIEAAFKNLSDVIEEVEAMEALRESGAVSDEELCDLMESMTALESLTTELSDGKLLTDEDIDCDCDCNCEDGCKNSSKRLTKEYDFDADGTEDSDELDIGDDDDDDLDDLIDDEF